MWWMAAVAWAAAPQGVDLDDLDKWQGGVRALTSGPGPCFVLEGTADLHAAMLTAPDRFSGIGVADVRLTGPFSGRLERGVWQDFTYDLEVVDRKELEDGDIDLPVVPLVGTWQDGEHTTVTETETNPDGTTRVSQTTTSETTFSLSIGSDTDGPDIDANIYGAQAVSLLRQAIDEWGSPVSTSYARWSAEHDGVEWVQHVPIRDGDDRAPEVEVNAFFPGGQDLPVRIDAVWPRTIKIKPDDVPIKVTIKDAQMRVRSEVAADLLFPVVESASLVVGVLGFTVGYDQTLTYRAATPCVPSGDAPPTGPSRPDTGG